MKGMSRRETSLGWTVHRVHYSADPDKDPATPQGRIWYENARKGVRDRDFRKEYEIDYAALGGQLVFPEFDESIHYVEPHSVEITNAFWTVWQGADPHPRRAHAFVWLGVNRRGDYTIPCSWWPEDENREREDNSKNRLLIREYAERLKAIDSNPVMFPAPWQRVMDQAGKNFNADEEHNFFDAYQNEGLYFQPAKKNREYAGYDLISKALTPTEYQVGDETILRPRLTILRGVGDNDKLVQQFKNLRFKEYRGVVVDKDPPSDPMNKERHLIDCVSYILLDDPMFIDQTKRKSAYKPIYGALGY